MFKFPSKQLIVNSDSQCRLLEDDGTTYADGDCTPTGGGFIIENFLPLVLGSKLQLLASATRIRSQVAVTGAGEIAAWTVTAAGGAKKGDVYSVVCTSLDLSPSVFQNGSVIKRYQLRQNCADAGELIAELAAVINLDADALVTAYAGFNNASPAQDDSAKIVLAAKNHGIACDLYVGSYSVEAQVTYTVALAKDAAGTTVYHTVEDTSAETAVAVLDENNYEALKSVKWPANLDYDRNDWEFPWQGAAYKMYYFEVNWTGVIGGSDIAGQTDQAGITPVQLYVNTAATTLITAMDLLAGDVNV